MSFVREAKSQGTKQQYQESASYRKSTANKVFRDTVIPNWIGDRESKFWYRCSTGPGTHSFYLVDCLAGTKSDAFDHAVLAEKLSRVTGKTYSADALDLSSLQVDPEASEWTFRSAGATWLFDVSTQELTKNERVSEGADTERLQGLKEVQRSRNGGDRVKLWFENRLSENLEYHWVRADGSLQLYGELGSGKSVEISTFVGHAWLLKNAQGQSLAAFVASADRPRAVVDGETPQPVNRRRSRVAGDRDRNQSPDGKWVVRSDGVSVTVTNLSSQQESVFRWSDLHADFVDADCEPGRVWWSPDSQHLVMLPAKSIEPREVSIVESSPAGSVHPVLHQFRYVKPGDSVSHPRPIMMSLQTNWVPTLIDDALFSNPYSLSRLEWSGDSSAFSFLYNQRGHQCLRLITVDVPSAIPRVCIDEQSETFVCYSQKTFLHRIESTNEWIWMSERSGWNHLYLINGETGEVKNAITSGQWVVRSVENVDEKNRKLLLSVSGINPEEDPYHQHLVRVGFDGGDLVRLTEGDGDHSWRFSPNGNWLIDQYSRVDLPLVTELRSARTGAKVCDVEKADITHLLNMGWHLPERFVAMGRDGKTPIYGVIVRPLRFEAGKKYPVLEHIYAGPHSSFVPKTFGLHSQLYEMAELGFVVVKIDGMGTSNRSKAFHDVCWKNLGDSGFPDRIAWMKAAAADRPEMDLGRVGIWGGSAGGQSAMRALIAYGDFYDAASADCGCHDNRVDKIWWNEQWMGWPIGPHYEEHSNVAQAHRMQGDLLLIWGELDRNVDPASSMQVVNALVRADKDFTQLIVPGAGHGAASHPYAKRQQADFFVRKLWGTEPRSE